MLTTANILIAVLTAALTFTLIATFHYRKRWMESAARAKELLKEANSHTALVATMVGGTRTTTTSGGIDGSRRYSIEFSYGSLGDLQAADQAWTQLSTNLIGLLRLATCDASSRLEKLDHD